MSSPAPRPVSRRPARVDPLGAPWPALIPLRPQTITDLLSGAARLVARRAVVLIPLALGFALASAGTQIAVSLLFPPAQRVLPVDWSQRVFAGQMSVPAGVLWPTLAATLVELFGLLVVSGFAAALAASDVLDLTRPTIGALDRLRSRRAALLGVAAVVALAVSAGLILLAVPGAIAFAVLSLAVPAVPLERARLRAALRRSVDLSRGYRLRIFGVMLLTLAIATIVSTVVGSLVPIGETTATAWTSLVVAAGVSSLTTPWSASVLALLYIDTRMRKENLAANLIRASMRG